MHGSERSVSLMFLFFCFLKWNHVDVNVCHDHKAMLRYVLPEEGGILQSYPFFFLFVCVVGRWERVREFKK